MEHRKEPARRRIARVLPKILARSALVTAVLVLCWMVADSVLGTPRRPSDLLLSSGIAFVLQVLWWTYLCRGYLLHGRRARRD